MTQTHKKIILTSNSFTPTVVVKLYLNTTVRMRSRICNNERIMRGPSTFQFFHRTVSTEWPDSCNLPSRYFPHYLQHVALTARHSSGWEQQIVRNLGLGMSSTACGQGHRCGNSNLSVKAEA